MFAVTSIFDLRGPDFLSLYLSLIVVGVVVAAALRRLARGPGAEATTWPSDLGAYDVAYLRGGADSVVAAAVVALLHRGLVRVSLGKLEAADGSASSPQRRELETLERAVLSAVERERTASLSRLRRTVNAVAQMPARTLESLGLIVPDSRKPLVRLAGAAPMVVVLAVGLAKTSVGISRGKPVGFLVALWIVVLLVTAWFAFAAVLRTRRGDRALAAIRTRSAALRSTAAT